MISSHFRLFIRNILRQRLFSAINLLGLTISITTTIIIYLYVQNEMSYDRFHPHSERLYRINQTFIWGDNNQNQFSRTGPGVAVALKDEFPEVELITSLHTPGNFIMSFTASSNEVISFEEDDVFAADTNFFAVFGFPMIKGDPKSAFRLPNTLVMSKSTAHKYFQDEDPLGKLVRLTGLNGDEQQTYEVIGVVEDAPDNSTIQFDVLLSMKSFPVDNLHWSWIWTQLETFILFRENTNMVSVRERLKDIPRKRAEETLQRVMNISYDEYIASGKKWELFLQPVASMHLPEENVIGSFPDTGNIKIIYSFIGAAIFVMILSCVNFMNLSTAQFTRRIKEASVRKILGLSKKELGLTYFLEALIFCFVAAIVAVACTEILLPYFNFITEKSIQFNVETFIDLSPALLLLILAMASVSSIYPAIFLGNFHPADALKGKMKSGANGRSFRDVLVVFQFGVSVILIICTAIVFDQLNYVSEKDMGFDRENLVEVEHVETLKNHEAFLKDAVNIPGAMMASLCTATPPSINNGDSFSAEGLNGQNFSLNYVSADENYIPTLGVKLKHGRNFSKDFPEDANRVIVNETMLKRLGWNADESSLGKKIMYPGEEDSPFEIIGIVSDFNYWSLAAAIEPMAIFHIQSKALFHGSRKQIALRIQPQSAAQWETTLASLNEVWKKHAGDVPFDYGFVDESFADTFKTQSQFGKVLVGMASLAILIAGLGLLGMIVYALEQRTKEIGIRKISGATVWNILTLISTGYTKLIIVAFCISAPVAYWLMNIWLQDFAYRVTPSIHIFMITGIAVLSFAILITSYHAVKAALTNPVDVLKDE